MGNARTEKVKRHRKKKLEAIQALKNVPCADCGNVFPPICMDFDHLDASIKFDKISNMLTYSFSRILIEIKKCEIVCSNCHRIRTYNRGQHSPIV